MARVQVYLPAELHERMRELGLSPSELLQRAVQDEIRRRELVTEAEKYLADLAAEVGEPSEADTAYARAFVDGLRRPERRHVG